MAISVAMAVYNGEKYIACQIESILSQLESSDELVISYNNSVDRTLEIISEYEKNDERVHVYFCEKKGVLANFEHALARCKKDIIFLSDQDDVWVNNKVKIVNNYFEKTDAIAICHDKTYVDKDLNVLRTPEKREKKITKVTTAAILYRNCIQGSCLAFKKELLKVAVPFPKNIPMHDSWLGLLATCIGNVYIVEDSLLLYRMHENNVSPKKHRGFFRMLYDRLILLIQLLIRMVGNYDKSIIRK